MKPSDPGSVVAFQGFLRQNSLMFSCAESCTGGLLCREMTSRAGASQVFWGGAVTYDDGAKVSLLGVEPNILALHGAVSGPVAEAMVVGMLKLSRVAVAASLTGVAGPSGGSDDKPVGTVWIGVGATREGRGSVAAVRLRFAGTRPQVQRQASRWARVLARAWWESGMELDSLRSLADNQGKPIVKAFQLPSSFSPNPL